MDWPGAVRQRWVARVAGEASAPLPLQEAKRAATAMLHKRAKAEPRNWIGELNQIAAYEVDRAALQHERRRWPIDLMNGRRRGFIEQRDAILDAVLARPPEDGPAFQSDDYPLDYDADDHAKLPECLRRIAKPERFSDAA